MSLSDTNTLSSKDLARIFKILAEPSRLQIVMSMGLDCRPVSDIIEATGLSQSNVSFHLRILREAGIVKGERRGGFVFYCLYEVQLLDLLSRFDGWRMTCDAAAALQQKKAS